MEAFRPAPDAASPDVPVDIGTDESPVVDVALADAGAEILRALTSRDVALRRNHIERARRLLGIAASALAGEGSADD